MFPDSLTAAAFAHPVDRIEVLQTHISWVVLTGAFAYKIKKPVDLGFLDFSTLARRKFFCEEELRLNRRLAPELYLAVVPIAGTPAAPRVDGPGEPFEYALRMRQFPQEQRLDHVLARGALLPHHVDALAAEVARFHAAAERAAADGAFGDAAHVAAPLEDIFAQLAARGAEPLAARLPALSTWFDSERARRATDFAARRAAGMVRECHGDLHLANMVLLDGEVLLFDCLEFSENLRWIDVASDLAFAVMDLADRGRADYSARLLSAYIEATGDAAGLTVLPYYLFYRAMVRALVAAIRRDQPGQTPEGCRRADDELHEYLNLAETYTRQRRPRLVLTHGCSGSGKTTHTQTILEAIGAVRFRSDLERKRLFGVEPVRHDAQRAAELYGAQATRRTYDRLALVAETALRAGWTAIVDATFLRRAERDRFRQLAQRLSTPLVILDFQAPEEELRTRVGERARQGRDASDATESVLEGQLAQREPLADDERPLTIAIDTTRPLDVAELARQLAPPTDRSG